MNREKGFTLIELLVSIVIFSVIAVVLYSCFRGGIISYRRIEQEAEFQQRVRHVFLRLTKDVKNMVYISNIPFEGYNDKVSFITTLTESDSADINVGRVSYYLKENDKGKALIRKVEPLKDVLDSLLILQEENIEGGAPEGLAEEDTVILEGVSDFKCTYLYVDLYRTAQGTDKEYTDTEYEWVDFWETENGLPLGIKLELSISESAGNSRKPFYRQICIPASRLPDTALAEVNVSVIEQ